MATGTIGPGPDALERTPVQPNRWPGLAANRRAHRQDVMDERPEDPIDGAGHPTVDVERHLADVAAREPGLVPGGRRAVRDLGAGVAGPDHQHPAGVELRRGPILARVELGDVRPQPGREIRDARLAERARRNDHLAGLEPVLAGDQQEARIGSFQAVDVDAHGDGQVELARVGLEVVRDLVLRRKRVPRRGEGQSRKAVVAGGCEDAEAMPSAPPGLADAIVCLEDHEVHPATREVIPGRQASLSPADDDDVVALRTHATDRRHRRIGGEVLLEHWCPVRQ
jgi:hypothetical protein